MVDLDDDPPRLLLLNDPAGLGIVQKHPVTQLNRVDCLWQQAFSRKRRDAWFQAGEPSRLDQSKPDTWPEAFVMLRITRLACADFRAAKVHQDGDPPPRLRLGGSGIADHAAPSFRLVMRAVDAQRLDEAEAWGRM